MAATTTRMRAPRKPKATAPAPQSPAPQAPAKSDGLPTGKAREQLAKRIIKLREQKVAWDGDNGICAQVGIKTAIQGRRLMREFQAGQMIGASYNREDAKAKREAAAAK